MGLLSNHQPPLTDKNLPDQAGKVFIVTGATSGIGELLTDILFAKNAKIYLAARSAEKAQATIEKVTSQNPQATGELIYLPLDLNDLTTIKASADQFLRNETKLNVLFNNAGVMRPPQGSESKQGYELQIGTNNLAPFLFTQLLTPILERTAASEPAGSVRVVWVSSSAASSFSPKGGVVMNNLDYKQDKGVWHKYGVSKAGNILHAAEYGRRHSNILSVSLDPGYLKTPLYNNMPKWQSVWMNLVYKDPIFGAFTLLFAGLSSDVTVQDNGRFIEPFGKLGSTRADVEQSRRSKSEGGNGLAEEFYNWSEQQVAPFAGTEQ